MEAGSRRIGDIEVLRGVAILFVLIEHLRLNVYPISLPVIERVRAWAQFWDGVDLFFVISGFVIARSLLPPLGAAAPGSKAPVVVAFWVRRAFRLLPSAWLWILLTMTATVALHGPDNPLGHVRFALQASLASILDLENLFVARTFVAGVFNPVSHHWTLSLEEQFYVALPLLALAAGRRWLPWVLAAIAFGQTFLPREHAGNLFRTDGLALGVLLALWSRSSLHAIVEPTVLWRHRSLGVLVFVLLATLLALVGGNDSLPRFGIAPLVAAPLVALASYDRDYLLPRSAARRVLEWVGARSYTLYLCHLVVYRLTPSFLGIFRWRPDHYELSYLLTLLAAALGLTFVAAGLTHRFVERPCRLHGRHVAARIAARAAITPIPVEPRAA